MTIERADDATREWATAQRRAQGLPDKVEDPEAIAEVAAIFRAGRRAGPALSEVER